MKSKSKKVLLGGSSILAASSLVGSSMPVNVNAGGKEILGWIAAKFWALVACIGSIFTRSDSEIKESVEDIISNNSDIEEKRTKEELKVSKEKSEKRKLSMKECLERAGKLAEKLKEKLGDKIQLSLNEKNGCYSGKIKFNNSINFNTDIKITFSADGEKFLVRVGGVALGIYCVQGKDMTEEDKFNNVINYVTDWYTRVEARLKRLDELAKTGRFDLVKNPDANFLKLYPKGNLNLKIVDDDNLEDRARAIVYDIVADKLSFYGELDENANYVGNEGFFSLCFSSNKKLNVDKKKALEELSVFDRFVSQLKSNKNSNGITFKVSGKEAAIGGDQENLDAAGLCF